MAIKYGFYNSISGDRTYNATDFGSIFDGIIRDGIFESIYDKFEITIGSGLSVNVGKGKAWFNNTWIENDAVYPVTFAEAELLLNRIDAVVLEINATESVRANTIKVVQGTPSSTPANPPLTRTAQINQYPLCFVNIPPKAESLVAGNIDNRIGTTDCPYTVIESGEIPSLSEINELIVKTNNLNGRVDTIDNMLITNGDGHKVLTNKGQYKSLDPVELITLTTSGSFDPSPYLPTYSRFYFVLYGAGGGGGKDGGSGSTQSNYTGGGGGGSGGKTITPPLVLSSAVGYVIGAQNQRNAGGDTTIMGYVAGGGQPGADGGNRGQGGHGGTGTICGRQGSSGVTRYGVNGISGMGGDSDVGLGGTENAASSGYAAGGGGGSANYLGRPGMIKVFGLYV